MSPCIQMNIGYMILLLLHGLSAVLSRRQNCNGVQMSSDKNSQRKVISVIIPIVPSEPRKIEVRLYPDFS
ncbi:hypothetical protein LLG07_06145 [bacterium]|nr:hypothetical protein [bacterium]